MISQHVHYNILMNCLCHFAKTPCGIFLKNVISSCRVMELQKFILNFFHSFCLAFARGTWSQILASEISPSSVQFILPQESRVAQVFTAWEPCFMILVSFLFHLPTHLCYRLITTFVDSGSYWKLWQILNYFSMNSTTIIIVIEHRKLKIT